jgi:uncharacterized protein (TIGR02391 family)
MSDAKILHSRAKQLFASLSKMPHVSVEAKLVKRYVENLPRVVTDPDLFRIIGKLFRDGHHARAVEEAFKFLNNLVKNRSHLTEMDGSKLMKNVFSQQNPVLKLNPNISESERNEQLGYMEIFSGVMTGIRNPRAHDHDWEDSEERALELLGIANHLVSRVKLAMKV